MRPSDSAVCPQAMRCGPAPAAGVTPSNWPESRCRAVPSLDKPGHPRAPTAGPSTSPAPRRSTSCSMPTLGPLCRCRTSIPTKAWPAFSPRTIPAQLDTSGCRSASSPRGSARCRLASNDEVSRCELGPTRSEVCCRTPATRRHSAGMPGDAEGITRKCSFALGSSPAGFRDRGGRSSEPQKKTSVTVRPGSPLTGHALERWTPSGSPAMMRGSRFDRCKWTRR